MLGFCGLLAENWRQVRVENYFDQAGKTGAQSWGQFCLKLLILKIAHLLLKGKTIGTLGEGEPSDWLFMICAAHGG